MQLFSLFSSPHGEHKAVVPQKSWDASAPPEMRPQSRPRSLLVAPHCSRGRHFVLREPCEMGARIWLPSARKDEVLTNELSLFLLVKLISGSLLRIAQCSHGSSLVAVSAADGCGASHAVWMLAAIRHQKACRKDPLVLLMHVVCAGVTPTHPGLMVCVALLAHTHTVTRCYRFEKHSGEPQLPPLCSRPHWGPGSHPGWEQTWPQASPKTQKGKVLAWPQRDPNCSQLHGHKVQHGEILCVLPSLLQQRECFINMPGATNEAQNRGSLVSTGTQPSFPMLITVTCRKSIQRANE